MMTMNKSTTSRYHKTRTSALKVKTYFWKSCLVREMLIDNISHITMTMYFLAFHPTYHDLKSWAVLSRDLRVWIFSDDIFSFPYKLEIYKAVSFLSLLRYSLFVSSTKLLSSRGLFTVLKLHFRVLKLHSCPTWKW